MGAKVFVLSATALLVVCFFGVALAGQGPPPAEGWRVSLGAGLAVAPHYEGSKRYVGVGLPYIQASWRDIFFLGREGLGVNIVRGRKFKAGLGLAIDFGRDEDTGSHTLANVRDDALAGMGDVDVALGVRAFASWTPGAFTLRASVARYFGSPDRGLVCTLGASRGFRLGEKFVLTPGLGVSLADSHYMGAYFGVSPAQAAGSQFPAFTAEGGLKDAHASLGLTWLAARGWAVNIRLTASQLLGDAAQSPVSQADTSLGLMASVGYGF